MDFDACNELEHIDVDKEELNLQIQIQCNEIEQIPGNATKETKPNRNITYDTHSNSKRSEATCKAEKGTNNWTDIHRISQKRENIRMHNNISLKIIKTKPQQ